MKYDLVIKNCSIYDPQGEGIISELGFLAIRQGVIGAIGNMEEVPQEVEAKRFLDASGCLLMPGLVNGHCHAAMTLFRGLADDLPLHEWLNDHVFPAEAQFVSKEMVYWCTKLAAAEMLLSGTTTVADSYFFESHAAQALHESGMRAVAAQGVIDFPAPGVPDPSQNIHAAQEYIEAWQNKESLVTPAVFCHSPYTCGPQTIVRAKELAQQEGVLFFIHLAETSSEVALLAERYGKSPVKHLFDLGVLDPQTVAVHGVWLDQEDMDIIAQTGTKVITCPESNMKLASGTAPVADLLKRQIPLGLGTDGCASNNDLDLFGEMSTLAKLHKLSGMDPTLLSASEVMGCATSGGAHLLSLPNGCGRLQVGSPADCIAVNLGSPHMTPFYSPNLLVYGAKGSDVRHAVIAGRIVVEGGKVASFDVGEASGKVLELAEEVKIFAGRRSHKSIRC